MKMRMLQEIQKITTKYVGHPTEKIMTRDRLKRWLGYQRVRLKMKLMMSVIYNNLRIRLLIFHGSHQMRASSPQWFLKMYKHLDTPILHIQ